MQHYKANASSKLFKWKSASVQAYKLKRNIRIAVNINNWSSYLISMAQIQFSYWIHPSTIQLFLILKGYKRRLFPVLLQH